MFIVIPLPSFILWRIAPGDLQQPGPWIGQIQVLNPILADQYERDQAKRKMSVMINRDTGELIFETNNLLLQINDSSESADPAPETIMSGLANLLKWIRINTGQTQIPKYPAISHYESLRGGASPDLTNTRKPVPVRDVMAATIESRLYGATFDDLVVAAAAVNDNETVPLVNSLFVDALAAYDSEDHEQCFLMCAIAAEVALGTYLDDAYQRARSAPRPTHHMISDSEGTIRDPIYDRLANRTEFKALMHERPLYLVGRSVFLEDRPLYDQLVLLYGARNRIAHTGKTGVNDLQPTKSNSEKAIDAIQRLFAWLGIRRAHTDRVGKRHVVEVGTVQWGEPSP